MSCLVLYRALNVVSKEKLILKDMTYSALEEWCERIGTQRCITYNVSCVSQHVAPLWASSPYL